MYLEFNKTNVLKRKILILCEIKKLSYWTDLLKLKEVKINGIDKERKKLKKM